MKKKLLAAVMAGLLTLSLVGAAAAADIPPTPGVDTEDITPFAEEREWHFRVVNGKVQMRLWSITEGKWLTDWMDMEQ